MMRGSRLETCPKRQRTSRSAVAGNSIHPERKCIKDIAALRERVDLRERLVEELRDAATGRPPGIAPGHDGVTV